MVTNSNNNKQNNYLILFTIITITIILLDQITKYLIKTIQPKINFLFINIHYSTNTGAGFGILQNQSLILGIFSLIFAIVIITQYKKIPKTPKYQIATALLLAGTIGNMFDRLIHQEVTDFIATSFWPSFNIADSAITVAVIILIYTIIREKE